MPTAKTKIKVEYGHALVADLHHPPYNPRTIDDAAKKRLMRGVEKFGIIDPLIVRMPEQDVLGGNQRLDIATELGMDEVPVVLVKGLTDGQARVLNVLLNNPQAQGRWDVPRLSDLLDEIVGMGEDATETGFDDAEIDNLIKGVSVDIDMEDQSDEFADDPQVRMGVGSYFVIPLPENLENNAELRVDVTELCERWELDFSLKRGTA